MCAEDRTKANEARRFAEQLLSFTISYHNHKETMAHAGAAVQIGLLAAIMSLQEWPPKWAGNYECQQKVVTIVVFFVIWLITHVYVRWQLRNRRWAEAQNGGLRRILGKWSINEPCDQDLVPYTQKPLEPSWFIVMAGLLLPYPCGKFPPDHENEDFPTGIVKAIKERETGGSLILGEGLLVK